MDGKSYGGTVMTKEYISKTKEAVNFLTHIYSDDMAAVASILSHQADGHTEALIDRLYVVKLFIEEQIKYLRKI